MGGEGEASGDEVVFKCHNVELRCDDTLSYDRVGADGE